MSHDPYDYLITLWTTGRREYHRLTATYVTANSFLVASITFLLKELKNSESYVILLSNSESYVILLSLIGIFLCFNMKVAQSRLSGENYYWESNLQLIESEKLEKKKKEESVQASEILFLTLKKLMTEEDVILRAGKSTKSVRRNFGMKYHQKWFAKRMKLYPVIFGFIFSIFISFTVPYLLCKNANETTLINASYVILFIIGIIIIILLNPKDIDKVEEARA